MNLPSISVTDEVDQHRVMLFTEAFGFLGFGLVALLATVVVYGIVLSNPVDTRFLLTGVSAILLIMTASTELASRIVGSSTSAVREFIGLAGACITISSLCVVAVIVAVSAVIVGISPSLLWGVVILGAVLLAVGLRVFSMFVVLPNVKIESVRERNTIRSEK